MRSLFTHSFFALATTASVCLLLAGTATAGDPGGFSINQVGHGHHGHHGGHYGHHGGHYYGHGGHGYGHHFGSHYGYRQYGYRSGGVRFSLNLGSVLGGYRNYTPYRSYYADPFCYGPTYFRSSSPYGIYYGAQSSPRYYLPPTTQPAGLAYGPQAVKRFMGVDPDFALGDLNRENLQRDDPKLVLGDVVANRIEPKVRETNWQARRRALNAMNRGDEAFSKGQYAAALADYDKAITNAPDLAEGYLRRSFGLLASGRYSDAFDALRRAVTIDPQVTVDPHFELTDLYQGNQQVKQQHLENLARAALAAPQEGSYLVLLGAAMHYDKQIIRGEKFFRQAIKLGGEPGELAREFLPANDGAI